MVYRLKEASKNKKRVSKLMKRVLFAAFKIVIKTNMMNDDSNPIIRRIDCPVKYRFKVNGVRLYLLSAFEVHNHHGESLEKSLTPLMIDEIANRSRYSCVSIIREELEK
jgi:predicted DNA-binding helix-hairpin-helix protein